MFLISLFSNDKSYVTIFWMEKNFRSVPFMSTANPFSYSFDQKRYHTWNYHLRNFFGHKVFKIALDGGFDCPNRDGTVAHGGCSVCSAAGSGDFAGNRADDLVTQFNEIREKMHHKWKDGKYVAYFQ